MGTTSNLTSTPSPATIFDPRGIRVGFQLASGPVYYSYLNIYATGRQFTSAQFNSCELRLFNLSASDRNNIITQTSPLKLGIGNPPIIMTLDVGRLSYGAFRLFEGSVISSNISQPPDIGITFVALNNQSSAQLIQANTQSATVAISTIANQIASSQNLTLNFSATDRMIHNYQSSASLAQQMWDLQHMGVTAFVKNTTLYVTDIGKPVPGESILINAQNGMVGIPQVTAMGCVVQVMINPQIQLGGEITVESVMNPAANGNYIVIEIDFEIANRDKPFWYTLICTSVSLFPGAGV